MFWLFRECEGYAFTLIFLCFSGGTGMAAKKYRWRAFQEPSKSRQEEKIG